MPLKHRILGASLFLVVFFLSFVSSWIKQRLTQTIYIVTYIAIGHLVWVNYIAAYEFGLAVSLIVVIAIANLFFEGNYLVFYSNLFLILLVAVTVLLLENTDIFVGGFFLTYVSVAAFSYLISFQKFKHDSRLRDISREYEIIFNNVQSAIFLVNVDHEDEFKYKRLNKLHEDLTGLETETVEGKTPVEALGEEIGEYIEKRYRECVTQREVITYEEKLKLPAGEKFWLTRLSPVINNGKVEKIVGSSLDITERKKQVDRIEYLSFHDQLTDMYNRRYFENEIERLNKSRKLPISIVVADMDGLKYINDNYGHQTGDQFIEKVGELFHNSLRESDIAARVGGDEFSVILPETDADTVRKLCDRIVDKIEEFNCRQELPENIRLSFGYATKTSVEEDLEKIFAKADQRMYENKGRSRTEIR